MKAKHPIILSILMALVPVALLTAAGVVIVVTSADDAEAVIIDSIAVLFSIAIGFISIKKLNFNLTQLGFRRVNAGGIRRAYGFIPIICAELIAIVAMPITLKSGTVIVLYIAFTCFVGINEELYFRGLIFSVLRRIGDKKAILISALIFACGHAATALSGANPAYVSAQIAFAFLFGVVTTEILLLSGSIIPIMVWHFLHDLICYITGNRFDSRALVILAAQIAILVVFALIYWREIGRDAAESKTKSRNDS
jgi:membrane protease YdiL (CAAX protease family)